MFNDEIRQLKEGRPPFDYLGHRITKQFQRVAYRGTIDGYCTERKWWHVTYDDHDEEDMNEQELIAGIIKFQRRIRVHPSTEIDRHPAKSYINIRVAKVFQGVVFYGRVDKFFESRLPCVGQFNQRFIRHNKWWHVTYEDGDQEDMNKYELELALRLRKVLIRRAAAGFTVATYYPDHNV